MEFTAVKLLSSILLPPTGLILLGLLGIGISLIWKKLGVFVAAISLLGLLICSLPVFTSALMDSLQDARPLTEKDIKTKVNNADAVVVLAGGRNSAAPEYGGDTLSALSLERARYAAWLVKRTGLSLIVSGGRVFNEEKSEAELMREVLQKEFIVIVDYIETESRNTYENAKYTAQLLKQHNMKKIALVTHAWHMPRAVAAFEEFGIEVVPAPTGFYGRSPDTHSEDFMPSYKALWYSGLAFHELLGSLWYSMRYY
jgi:uncharacterized SAM-binding protein YcdF (DUF218 family)